MKHAAYHNAAGKRLPSVTTIINRFKDSGGLIRWASQCGLDGVDIDAVKQDAATAGTLAHDMVEADLRGTVWAQSGPVDTDVLFKAKAGFSAFLTWKKGAALDYKYSEVPLVSEEFQFGGRLDAIGAFDNQLCLIDWKTSNAVYQDHLIQMAAYKALWEENYPDRPITGGFHLCRFSKEHGDFAHHYYPDLSEAWEAFRHMRRLYDLTAALKKRAS